MNLSLIRLQRMLSELPNQLRNFLSNVWSACLLTKIYANVEMALIRTAYPPFASATQIPVYYAIVLYMLGEIFREKMT